MKVLYLITARGGSKGVPRKNLRTIGGLTLIEWKVRAARACDENAQLYMSTDSVDIANEATRLRVPTLVRPDFLATDEAKSRDVVLHALEELRVHGEIFDAVMLLEPSSPFATGAQMRRARMMMEAYEADLIVGMREVEPSSIFMGEVREDHSINPIIMRMQRQGVGLRRQDVAPEWTMNGALYLFTTKMFLETNDIYGGRVNLGLLMPRWHGLEIDTMDDLELAEYAFAKGYVA